jgi:signal transduction histidine kinase
MLVTAMLAFGVGMHVAIDRMARQAAERELADRARVLVAQNELSEWTSASEGAGLFRPRTGALDFESEVLEHVQMFQPNCSITRAFSTMRRLVSAGQALPVSDEGLDALRAGQTWVEQYLFLNEVHLIYNQPIVEDDRVVGVAQVAQSLTDEQQMLATLRDGVLFGSGAAAALVFGLTWGLAGRALLPLARMTRDARAIATQRDFTRRLEPPRRGDELGQLSAALNAALNELHAAYHQAESELATQRGAVADVSHELRAPLTTVRGNLSLLQRELPMDASERAAILRDAIDEIERMSRLVNEILLLSRAGQQGATRIEPVDVAPIASEMRRKALALAQGRSIALDVRAARSVVLGNADALNQVLLILLDNAIKYTPLDGRIAISLDSDDARAHISVIDNGAGIAPEAVPHVFERYYRADATSNGLGLGLSIAKSLVQAQGGTIDVRSSLGHGTMFTVSLPLAD